MPKREDIDSFKQQINLWGDEPKILEALGEPLRMLSHPNHLLSMS
jgi:hypothetical protein